MEILPAIDLREGKCIRLLQGDYDRQIDYHDDPVAQAAEFEPNGYMLLTSMAPARAQWPTPA